MSYFGAGRAKPSFFNDPMFSGVDLSGLDPGLLQGAIDDNASARRPEKGTFGDSTFGKIIGILGDGALGFVGQPAAYGPSIDAARQRHQEIMDEYEQRQRQRMERREDMQWEWENEPEDPYIANRERLARWYEPDKQAATPASTRARARMMATQNGNMNGDEFRNVVSRPYSLFGRGGW